MEATAGSVKEGFNWSSIVVPALVSVATFAVMGYIDNAIFDVFFFDPIHASQNGTATALKGFMHDHFGWVHDLTGFTGDSGLLHMWPFNEWLAPYYPAEQTDLASALSGIGGYDATHGGEDYLNSMMHSDYSEYEY